MEGDSDVGLDKFVQVVSGSMFTESFFVQVKGTEKKAAEDASSIQVSVSVTTINYWLRQNQAVMLVVCDLSQKKPPALCPSFYLWITRESVGSIESGQQTKTIQIPRESRLDDKLNVVPYLANLRMNREAQEELFLAAVDEFGGEAGARNEFRSAALTVKREGSFAVAAVTSSSSRSSSKFESKAARAALPRIDALIFAGHDREAERELERDQRLSRPQLGSLEATYLRGRIAMMRGLTARAHSLFEQAANGAPRNPRYVAAVFECRFRDIYSPELPKGALLSLAASMPRLNHARVKATRARILGAAGAFREAKKWLAGIPERAAPVEQVLLPYMQQDWNATIRRAKKVSEANINQSAVVAVRVLACRALVNRDLGMANDGEHEMVAPTTGLPNWNYKLAWSAWQEISDVLASGAQVGWPTCLELLVDVYSILASALEKEAEGLRVLTSFANARPAIATVRYHAIRLAILSRNSDEALNLIQSASNREELFREEITALYSKGLKSDLLKVAQQHLLAATDIEHPLHIGSLVVSFVCALELARVEQASEFEKKLESRSEWAGELAVARFVATVNTEPLRREQALRDLQLAFEAHPSNGAIQDHLFNALEPNDEEAATAILIVAKAIEQRRRLSLEEIGPCVRAYWTLNRADLALQFLDTYGIQYPDDPKMDSYRAISLDQLGRTAESLVLLEKAGRSRQWIGPPTAYVNLALRSGLYEKAIVAIEEGLARASKAEDKRRLIHQLFTVVAANDPGSSQLQELAWRFGQLVDQSDEKQEGVFLQMFLMSPASESSTGRDSNERQEKFATRASSFFARFPDSDVVKKIALPTGKTADSLRTAIESLDKSTPEAQLVSLQLRNQLERGTMIAPYAWRPKNILKYVRDIAHLWELTKRAGPSDLALLLTMTDGNPRAIKAGDFRDRMPIVDLITLLVLHDLAILDLVFDTFPRVGILKSTLVELQHLSNPMLGTSASAIGLRKLLAQRAGNIIQIGADESADSQESRHARVEREFRIALLRPDAILWTDDLAFHASLGEKEENGQRICTTDVIGWLEQQGRIDLTRATQLVAQLARWNIQGVPVEGRFLTAAISAAIGSASTLDELIARFDADATLLAIIDGLWDWKATYLHIANHAARVSSYIASMESVRAETVAAVWDLWLRKVRLRTDVSAGEGKQLAVMLVRSAMVSGKRPDTIRKLWGAYVALVTRRHGTKMTVALEKAARRLVGVVAAEFSHANTRDERDRAAFELLSSGLVKGTMEYDEYADAYEERSIALQQEGGLTGA